MLRSNFSAEVKEFPLMLKRLKKLLRSQACLSESQITQCHETDGRFGRALVINMESRRDRLESCRRTLEKVGISWTRFSAVIGKEVESKFLKSRFDILRPGELGCLLSHLCIALVASEHPDPEAFTIIFEDDIVSSSGRDAWKSALHHCNEVINKEEVDLIYFGKCLERCSQMVHIRENIYRAVAPSCCHAYAIRNGFAKKMLLDLEHCDDYPESVLNRAYFNRGIDSIYGDYIINGLAKALVFHPALFYQDVLGGRSDLRQEFMINYQECNDTNPPCPAVDQRQIVNVQFKGRRGLIIAIVILVILVVAIVVALAIWQRRAVGKFFRGPGGTVVLGAGLGAFVLAVVLFVIVFLVVIIRKNRIDSRGGIPNWASGFPTVEQTTLPTLVRYCRKSRPPQTLTISEADLLSKEYEAFNPNGFSFSQRSKFHYQWLDSGEVIVTTSRCSNGRNSYPLVRIYTSNLDRVLESKVVKLDSHRALRDHHMLGFEDMRIFLYRKKPYMIGVNLDRDTKNLPSMCLVKLDWNFDPLETWHLRYDPLANFPNKNWAPLTLPNGELGFLVDIDPLLIVRRRVKGHREQASRSERSGRKIHVEFAEDCQKVVACAKQTEVEKVRNSTTVYRVKDLSRKWQDLLERIRPRAGNYWQTERYVLLGHVKYVEADYIPGGVLVLYQHYFVIIDLPLPHAHPKVKPHVWLSKPFHVEQEHRPHIEYISGMAFRDDELIVMYGLRDEICRYQSLDLDGVERLLAH